MLAFYLTFINDADEKKLFENLFYAYRKQMVSQATAILNNEDDAEDVVHDVFLRIATKYMGTVKEITEDSDLRNYLLKATKNTALTKLKQEKRNVVSFDAIKDSAWEDAQVLSDENFFDGVCKSIDYQMVLNTIAMLDVKYREVIYYHLVVELPVVQVADMLQQTVSATKQQLVRGKKILLSLLEAEGVENDGNYER